jgi:hypothetical protein
MTTAGCSVKQRESGENSSTDNAEALGEPEGPSLAARLFGGGKPMPLDIQKQLANGTVIYIRSIQAKETETVLGVKIVNGFERDVELDWSTKKTFLAAGGEKFYLSPPIDNKDVRVGARSTMEGELVFLGTLPQSGQVTLVINEGMSDGQYSGTPGISIPITTSSAAWSDDGSKKILEPEIFA